MTTTKPGYKWVGTRPIRHDGLDKVTGRARFGADMAMPGDARRPRAQVSARARNIVSIDTSAAEKMDGVKAIVTGTDFPLLEHDAAQGGEGRSRLLRPLPQHRCPRQGAVSGARRGWPLPRRPRGRT